MYKRNQLNNKHNETTTTHNHFVQETVLILQINAFILSLTAGGYCFQEGLCWNDVFHSSHL